MAANTSAEESEVIRAPNWLRELEEKRERRIKGKLGHEAGAGSPCLECKERCPGLDLHFWRKICKNCKCGKENHDVQDDDMYGLLQIQQPKKNQKIVLPGRKEEVVLEWTPKGTKEALESYFKDLPPELLPIKGSSAAQERKQNLQKQFPVHDVDPTLCHALTEEETQQMNEYVDHLKENSVGVGQLIHIAPKKQNLRPNTKKHDYENIDAFGNHKLTAEIERLQLDEDVNLAVAQYALLLDKSSLPLRDRNGSPIKAELDVYNEPVFSAEVYEKIGPLAKAEYAILLDKNGAPILNSNDIPVKNSIVYKPPLGELCDKFGNKIYPQFALLLDKNRSVLKDPRFNSPIKVAVDVFGYPVIDRSLAEVIRAVQPEYACFLDRNGAVILDNGKPVTLDLGEKAKFAMLLDKGRNLIDGPIITRLDSYGAPILDEAVLGKLNGAVPQFAVMLNAKREVIYDKFNKPVEHCMNVFTDKISDKFGNEIRPQFGLLLDKNEAPIKDATGSPIRVLLDAFCRPVIDEATIEKVKMRTPEFVMFLDRNGAPILDKYGSPIKNVASSVKSSSNAPKYGLLLDQNEQVLKDYLHNPITVNLDPLNRAVIEDSIASEYKPRYSVLMDETNSPILDANGKAVKEDLLNRALGSKAKFASLLDKNRAPLRDAHGNPVQVHLDALARPVLTNSAQPKFAALLDGKGLPIFNEYGQVLQEIVDPYSNSKFHSDGSTRKGSKFNDASNRYDGNPDGSKTHGKYPSHHNELNPDKYDNYEHELNKKPANYDDLVDKYNNPINIDNATLTSNGKPILDQYGVPMKIKVDQLGRVILDADSPKLEEVNQAVLTKQGAPLLDKFGTPLALTIGNGGALTLQKTNVPIYTASGAQIRAGYPHDDLIDKYNNPINIDNATLTSNGKPILDQYGVPMKIKVDPLGRVILDADSPKLEELNQAVLTKQGAPLLDKFGTPLALTIGNGGVLTLQKTNVPIYSASGAQIRAGYPHDDLIDKYNNPINIDNATLTSNGKPILDQYGAPMKIKVDPLGRVILDADSPKLEEVNQAVLTKQGAPLLDKFGSPLALTIGNGGALTLQKTNLPIYSASGAQIRAENALPTKVNIGAIQDINYPTYTTPQRPVYSALKVQEANQKQESAKFDEIESAQCHRCKQIFEDNALVIQIERSEALWHASCFKCKGCNQNLADLVYFFHSESDDVYCGRDFAKIRGIPRCNACDELIFVKEYCLAEHNTYHVKHFCCFECDSPLAGQQYVIENNQPVCIGCYENLKADKCNSCERIIKPDEQGANLNGTHFHANDECFACKTCRKPLLGGKFLFRNLRLYCSGACFNADQ